VLPLHRWVPWIAGFSAPFVDDCLEEYISSDARPACVVLDPFAGVGTTLLQAYTHGLDVIGFEINPYAALAAKLKLQADTVPAQELRRQISDFEHFMERHCPETGATFGAPQSTPPIGFTGRTQLFSPKVERKILFALDFINLVGNPHISDLFRLALGSIMITVSNYSYEPSLTRRSAVDKDDVLDASVCAILSSKLKLMLADIEWLQEHMRHLPRRATARVFADSFFVSRERLEREGFVDLVVTSPPYLNNYHYPRNTRPQLYWLGLGSGPGYKAAREEESFGKFWQTVRDKPRAKLAFRFPPLEEIIETIRSRNTENGTYGGPGWANYVVTYFNDAYRFSQILATLLKPNAVAVIVLGNSIIQGIEVKTDEYFGRIGELHGLKFEKTMLLRNKRTGTSIIRSSVRVDKAASKTALYESAIILRR
jgi:hypothetical protein